MEFYIDESVFTLEDLNLLYKTQKTLITYDNILYNFLTKFFTVHVKDENTHDSFIAMKILYSKLEQYNLYFKYNLKHHLHFIYELFKKIEIEYDEFEKDLMNSNDISKFNINYTFNELYENIKCKKYESMLNLIDDFINDECRFFI